MSEQGLTRDEVLEQYKQECNFFVNGECSTLICLRRGGYDSTNRLTVQPTCAAREVVEGVFMTNTKRADE